MDSNESVFVSVVARRPLTVPVTAFSKETRWDMAAFCRDVVCTVYAFWHPYKLQNTTNCCLLSWGRLWRSSNERYVRSFTPPSSPPAFVSPSHSHSADFQRSTTPPLSSACGIQTTSPTCLCLSSLSLLSLSPTQFTLLPPPPLHLVTMETLGPYGDKLMLVHKESKCVCLRKALSFK
ncbi:hypothetical protein F7725_021649, partial [Dissostichus mawsoni]